MSYVLLEKMPSILIYVEVPAKFIKGIAQGQISPQRNTFSWSSPKIRIKHDFIGGSGFTANIDSSCWTIRSIIGCESSNRSCPRSLYKVFVCAKKYLGKTLEEFCLRFEIKGHLEFFNPSQICLQWLTKHWSLPSHNAFNFEKTTREHEIVILIFETPLQGMVCTICWHLLTITS